VTESRLASIAAQLGVLAIETDPYTTRRLDQLEAQRDQIDARMAQIRRGEASTLDDGRALERVGEIITQAQDVPADFARVQARFEELNRSLRAAVVESEGSQRRVLDEIFRGVDLIDDSEEGRTFAAFASLVLDPVVSASFEDDIAQILARPFAARLTTAERRMLRRFLSLLKERSAEIQEVITSFARGLRRYVQSQEYQRDRVLRSAIQDALGAGVRAAAGVKPYEPTSLVLDLSAMRMTSVGEISLHDPAELDASDPIEEQELSEVDLAELKSIARLSEIDFDELRKLDMAFHLSIVAAAGNRFLEQTQGVLHTILAEGMETTLTVPGRLAKSRRDHTKIMRAILAGDPAPFPNTVTSTDAPAVPRGYVAAVGRSGEAASPSARASSDEERAATSLLATGVFTGQPGNSPHRDQRPGRL
jgi:hypothetical protein